MDMIAYVLVGLLGFICFYATIDRVCKCFETCSLQKNAAESLKNGENSSKNC